jgi:hypothetical protein
MDKPALVMDELKSEVQKGQVALYDLTGATCFANFTVTTTPDAEWKRHLPPMPLGRSQSGVYRQPSTRSGAIWRSHSAPPRSAV